LLSQKVFLNRALLGYVPGSIWKPVTLITALDAMAVKPNERFHVNEAFYLGMTRFGDWTSKEGTLSLEECLAWSRDTAFYQIGRRLTPEQIKKWGVKLGAGRKTGIELLGEEKGIVPDEKWKKEKLHEPWYPGNTLHYAIGQSFLLVTPTQAARMYSGIATGAKLPRLQLIKKIYDHEKSLQGPETFQIDQNLLQVVKKGLEMCIESGTGQAAKLEGIKVAGKTGSAEVHSIGKTHGWFAAYAPADKPEVVVIAITEKAGHGGTVAAPIVKKILEEYFKINPKILAKK
jgi:penicillin-binding protein 2